ncbi:hypothetical protein PI124_g20644 [Phytophthora idaei]|nr:hypothetical protein PI125_g22046 [Phytophthora idaei]KAG3234299.1 hypothetical protein PI124_g20644 [Phytophthora idaei]
MGGFKRLEEAVIGADLRDEFGLLLDGWSHTLEH